MPQVATGLRSILSLPSVYDLFQRLVGVRKARKAVVGQYVRPRSGDRVLDLGCGTGDILELLPEVRYLGVDLSPGYVAAARKRYGHRGTFWCGDASETALDEFKPFDLAIALGFLHHVDDKEARRVLGCVRSALAPGGRLVTWDPCLVEGQSRIARTLIRHDRGQNVRRLEEYRDLAGSAFPQVIATVRHDLLRIPYTHAIMECHA